MHTTASDMAKLMLALIHDGRSGEVRILQPETVELMRRRTTRYRVLFRRSEDLQARGRGLGILSIRGGWFGIGGSAPGYQCLFRFHAILGGGPNYPSARAEIYRVQDTLVSVLDPTHVVRRRAAEIGIVGVMVLYLAVVGLWLRRRRLRRRDAR